MKLSSNLRFARRSGANPARFPSSATAAAAATSRSIQGQNLATCSSKIGAMKSFDPMIGKFSTSVTSLQGGLRHEEQHLRGDLLLSSDAERNALNFSEEQELPLPPQEIEEKSEAASSSLAMTAPSFFLPGSSFRSVPSSFSPVSRRYLEY